MTRRRPAGEHEHCTVTQSLLDASLSLKVNLGLAHTLPKPRSPECALSLTGFRLPESEVHKLTPYISPVVNFIIM